VHGVGDLWFHQEGLFCAWNRRIEGNILQRPKIGGRGRHLNSAYRLGYRLRSFWSDTGSRCEGFRAPTTKKWGGIHGACLTNKGTSEPLPDRLQDPAKDGPIVQL